MGCAPVQGERGTVYSALMWTLVLEVGSAAGEGLALPCALRWPWFGESQSGPHSIFLHHLGSQSFRRLSGIYFYWNSFDRTVPLALPISFSSHFCPDSNSYFSESAKGSLPVSLLHRRCYWFSIYFLFIYQHIITCKDITLLFATILALSYLSWQTRNPVCWNPYWNFNSSEGRKFKWDFSLWNA